MANQDMRGEFARGWKPLLGSAIGIGLGLAPIGPFTSGVFAVQLQHEFGWSRASILAGQFTVVAALLLLGPVVGRLADRLGAKRIAVWSAIGLGLGFMSLSLVTAQIWTYYLLYGLMCVVGIGTMPIIYGRVVSLWFDRYRGLALGIALCMTGVSGIFLPIYAQALIGHFGWRWAYVGVGALSLCVGAPLLALLLPGAEATGAEVARGREGDPLPLEGVEIAAVSAISQ
jgi:MFS family permease